MKSKELVDAEPHPLTPKDKRRLREKRGQGEGSEYRPWVEVGELPSNPAKGSKRYLIKNLKSGRLHHLLSAGEAALYKLYQWRPEVLDIREQFPLLPVKDTRALAERMGIEHPHEGTFPMVLTLDLLLTVERDGSRELRAVSFKKAADLDKVKTVRRQELERRYLMEYGIDGQAVRWCLVTERELPAMLVRNLEWLDPDYKKLGRLEAGTRAEVRRHLEATWTPDLPLTTLAVKTDAGMSLEKGTALALAQQLILDGIWQVELMKQEFRPNHPLPGLRVAPTESEEA